MLITIPLTEAENIISIIAYPRTTLFFRWMTFASNAAASSCIPAAGTQNSAAEAYIRIDMMEKTRHLVMARRIHMCVKSEVKIRIILLAAADKVGDESFPTRASKRRLMMEIIWLIKGSFMANTRSKRAKVRRMTPQ